MRRGRLRGESRCGGACPLDWTLGLGIWAGFLSRVVICALPVE